jgi:hypothetical protein
MADPHPLAPDARELALVRAADLDLVARLEEHLPADGELRQLADELILRFLTRSAVSWGVVADLYELALAAEKAAGIG